MSSLRQQHITEQQVRAKIQDARNRAAEGMAETRTAKTAAEYGAAVRKVNKAAEDHRSWGVVLKSLGRPVV